MRELRLKVRPLRLRGALDFWATEETLLARDAWVEGPKKPRDVSGAGRYRRATSV